MSHKWVGKLIKDGFAVRLCTSLKRSWRWGSHDDHHLSLGLKWGRHLMKQESQDEGKDMKVNHMLIKREDSSC